ncbi:MAG: CheY-like chemotaxis protein [Polyangiales bacterium]
MEAHVAVKILAVDDSAVMRKIMEMTFAGEDAEVLTAASADEGLAAAQRFAPDIVFADASMAGKDGYAVASAIKSKGGNAPVVIVMASQHTPYDEAKGAASGVDDHVAKPFDSQAIIDKVNAAMSGAVSRKPAPAPAGGPVQASSGQASSGTPARSLKRTMAFGSPPPRPPAPPAPPAAKAQLEVVEEDDDPVIELSAPPAARVQSKRPQQPERKAAPAPAAAASPAAAATAPDSALAGSLDALGLSKEQVESVLALSRDIVEKVVWEVVPDMAETLIREEIRRLMK